jgi:hypothetical protein
MLFVAKEIIVGVAQIIWALVSSLVAVIVLYPALAIMWTITRLGFWHMPDLYDNKGHFQLPWK